MMDASDQQKKTEVSTWLHNNAKDTQGLFLFRHMMQLFSSGLTMKKFIHEGTGKYWGGSPDHWVRWIIMRTNDENDQTFKLLKYSRI
jgi:hypothetical protein